MDHLGIAPETLYMYLATLLVLLALIFTFIFLGIKSFTTGGAFGAVINSLLPMIGAGGVGAQDKEKDKLNPETIKKAVEAMTSSVEKSVGKVEKAL